jgi:signal transduction histidine kinase
MKLTTAYLFLISLFVTLQVGLLSYFQARKYHSRDFSHLAEFWFSLTAMTVISYFFRSSNPQVVALSLVGWIWPVKTITQILEDMTGKKLVNKILIIVPVIGAITSLALAVNQTSFLVITLPFSIGLGIVGTLLLSGVYQGKSRYSLLGNSSFIFVGLFFFLHLFFPYWRMNQKLIMFGTTAHILILVGLATTTFSFYLEVLKNKHEKQWENLLKERSDQLFGQSKYSELGMMSAGIAHEINNPLAIIQAKTTQLLRIHRDPQKVKELSEGLEQIMYTSERINRTIQGIREFVHQDERLLVEDFSVKELVEDVLAFCGQRMKNHGINLRLYGIDNLQLRGHKIQLEQVLLNLLNNSFDAIEFLPEKWIEISAQQTSDAIQLFVKDSGPGIPLEIRNRMMEPFFTTKNIGKGTGLGLALAKGILERHGGELSYIEKNPHTTFMIELPKVALKNVAVREQDHPVIH